VWPTAEVCGVQLQHQSINRKQQAWMATAGRPTPHARTNVHRHRSQLTETVVA
jgi:hypothetical protein